MSYPQSPNQPQDPNQPYGSQQPQDPHQPYGTDQPYAPNQPQSDQTPPTAPPYMGPHVPGPERTQPPIAPTAGEPYGGSSSYGAPGASGARPGGVTAASIMTWVGSALMLVLGFLLLAASGMESELADAGVPSEVMDILPVFGGFMMVVGIIAIVLGVLAFRRSKVGLYGLLVLGALYLILNIIGIASGAGGAGVVGIVWVVVACALLFRAKSWYDKDRTAV